MTAARVAPYGSWPSPVTSAAIVENVVRLDAVAIDGDDVYWTEGRPEEGGRVVVVRRSVDGSIGAVTPPGSNVRSRVHEYGGGAYAVDRGELVYVEFGDGRLYRMMPGADPVPLTPPSAGVADRYAEPSFDRTRGRLVAIREDHTTGAPQAVNSIVSIETESGGEPREARTLVEGNDFYSNATISPDGRRMAWLTWNHPNMPWDGNELWTATFAPDGSVGHATRVAGGTDESIAQPAWSPSGVLHFVSDRTRWWNLYRAGEGRTPGEIVALAPLEAEFASPQWVFGLSHYAFIDDERIVCAWTRQGSWDLGLLDGRTRELTAYALPYSQYGSIRGAHGHAVMIAASALEMPAVVSLDILSGSVEVLRRSSTAAPDARYVSRPEAVEFPTEGGPTAHGLYYAPHNPDVIAPAGDSPPLLVRGHGGPTAAVGGTLDPETQYWTSRGVGVLAVNYGGSSGYGRAYRERLDGQWGVVDVADCIAGARWLVAQGRADGDRLAMDGGSAGGYTMFCALTFSDVFRAGASFFGVADPEAMARDTHKFESRYMDRLIGPLPEARGTYIDRSPVLHADRLNRPVILFQGLDDRVVPPSQAERMVAALRSRGIPVAYLPFEGEGHGFRRAENIRRSVDAEFAFFARIFGYTPADDIEPVEIEGL
jgi:dipeptidyl aminopeptidase/acylaminoacyl peptidase